jgi:hypothetical protein
MRRLARGGVLDQQGGRAAELSADRKSLQRARNCDQDRRGDADRRGDDDARERLSPPSGAGERCIGRHDGPTSPAEAAGDRARAAA